MRYDDFQKVLSHRQIPIHPGEPGLIRGYAVDEFRKLARQTERIDYDCNFRDGTCRGRERGEKGCCWRCGETIGHWLKEEGPMDEDTARQLAGFYEPEKGFCRDDSGCVLPRELRSPTCLFIYCSDAKMSGTDLELLNRICNGRFY